MKEAQAAGLYLQAELSPRNHATGRRACEVAPDHTTAGVARECDRKMVDDEYYRHLDRR